MTERARKKAETRARILSSAALLFRKNGYAATGVDAVMEEAGLTAGGFYAHFESKDALLEECLRTALGEARGRLTQGLKSPAGTRARGREILARYLSVAHRDHPELGCPLVGIGAELGRHSRETTSAVSEHLERLVEEIRATGVTRAEALRAISGAVGALLLSRLVRGEGLSEEILSAAKG